MEQKINKGAWDILNPDEKTAITLSLGYGKSTWEGGEILKRAHFKYLEIQKRAQKFLEIFTNHFEKYGGLIPEDLALPKPFKEYIHLTIIMRKNISQTISSIEDTRYSVAIIRHRLVTESMLKLKQDNSEQAIDLYSLIMDFDRWNNFRILPVDIQEPSAFKRRNKARYKKHITSLLDIPHFSLLKIVERFTYNGKYNKYYLPLVSTYLDEGFKIIPMKVESNNLEFANQVGLFVFDDEDQANKYARLVSRYFLSTEKDCKLGQRFWPEFRIYIEKAVNFRELENIHKSRVYLDKAIVDFEKKRISPKKYRKKLLEDVSDDTIFYPR